MCQQAEATALARRPTCGNQKDGGIYVHPSQSRDDRAATEQQLATDQDVGHQSEEDEDDMSQTSVTRVYDFQKGVAMRSILLDFAS